MQLRRRRPRCGEGPTGGSSPTASRRVVDDSALMVEIVSFVDPLSALRAMAVSKGWREALKR